MHHDTTSGYTPGNPFSWMDRWLVIPVITGLYGIFVALILILGAFQRGPELLEFPTTLFLLYSLLTAAVWLVVCWLMGKTTVIEKPFVFPVLVTVLAALPRYGWMRLVETTPMWDFARYLQYAQSIVAGNPGAISDIRGVFPHLTGYPLILSYVLRIFGTEAEVARWFNFFCTLAAVLLLYYLGKTAFNARVGRLAALLFALWPGQVFYMPVLAAEHLFVVLMLTVLCLFALAANQENRSAPWRAWTMALAAGVVLSVAHIVRPVASLLIPAFMLFLLVRPHHGETTESEEAKPPKKWMTNWKALRAGVLVLLVLGFWLTLQGLNLLYQPKVEVPLGKTGAGFNLYVGTNQAARGMWNPEDWAIIEEFNYDFDRIHEEAWNRGMERIREDYRDFLLLAERKFSIQWAVSDYGFYWGMLETERVTAVSLWAEAHRQELQVASQVFYMSLMWLILLGVWHTRQKRTASFNTFIAILFFGFIAMHTLIEVQSRYHHSLVPLFILSAACGADRWIQNTCAERKRMP